MGGDSESGKEFLRLFASQFQVKCVSIQINFIRPGQPSTVFDYNFLEIIIVVPKWKNALSSKV